MVSKEEDGRSNPLKNSAKVSFLAFPPQETLPQKGDPANFKNSWRRRAVKPPFPILHSGTGRKKKLFPFPLWQGKKRWAHHFRRCYATRRQSFAHLVVFPFVFVESHRRRMGDQRRMAKVFSLFLLTLLFFL